MSTPNEPIKRRNWSEILPDQVRVETQSGWETWPGIQLIEMGHRLSQFDLESNFHTVFTFTAKSAQYSLRKKGHYLTNTMVRGDVSIISAHSRYQVETKAELMEDIGILVDPQVLQKLACTFQVTKGTGEEINDQFAIHNPKISQILHLLRDDVRQGHPFGSIYGDGLLAALVPEILTNYKQQLGSQSKALLTKDQVRQIEDFIIGNLSSKLTLATIAATVGYSPFYFHRMYFRSTGTRLAERILELR